MSLSSVAEHQSVCVPGWFCPLVDEKKHVGPPSALDEALAHYSVSREVPRSVLKCKTLLGTLNATPNVPRHHPTTPNQASTYLETCNRTLLLKERQEHGERPSLRYRHTGKAERIEQEY